MPTRKRLTRANWERYTEWPLVAAALLFLAAYAIPIIWPELDHFLLSYTNHVIIGTWIAFAVDYIARLALSRDKFEFFKRNVVDLLSIALPVLRPLRLLRVIAALSILSRFGAITLRGRVAAYSLGFALMVTFVSALAVTQAERGVVGANIHTFGESIWWAFTTLTSTGYGDFTPITTTGRTIGVILMLTGILLLGAVSASLASWLVQRTLGLTELGERADTNQADMDLLISQISALHNQVDVLSTALESHAANIRANQNLNH